LKFEFSAGGVVFRRRDGRKEILLIKDHVGNWALPKGHIDPGENAETAARREVAEETGLQSTKVRKRLPSTEYWFKQSGELIKKKVSYFLLEAESPGELALQAEEGIEQSRWVEFEKAPEELSYKNTRHVLEAAVTALRDLD
jgi:8-oxo-dGTP pyrophosphatase MutT (NUDIX family)